MRFCQSFMTELFRHIGPGHRRSGGRHRRRRPRDRLPLRPVQAAPERVRRRAHGQGPQLGRLADPARGHRLRLRLLRRRDARDARQTLEGKTCLVSGSGNVAQYTVEKLIELGAKVVTLSDSSRLHLRRGGNDRDEARVRHRPQERPARPHPGVRRRFKGAHLHARGPASSTTTRSGTSRPTARSRAPRRTRSTARTPRTCSERLKVVAEGANMPTDARRRATSSWTPASSTGPARPPTRAASRPRASRWRRTACVTAGRARKSTIVSGSS